MSTIQEDYAKCCNVIKSMNNKSIDATRKYIYLFRDKWNRLGAEDYYERFDELYCEYQRKANEIYGKNTFFDNVDI